MIYSVDSVKLPIQWQWWDKTYYYNNKLPEFQLLLPFILISLTATLLYYKFLKMDSKMKKLLSKIPGPPSLPLLGNFHEILVPSTDLLQKISSLIEIYGQTIRFWTFNISYVFISNAKDAELILSSTVHINKSRDYDIMRPWLGNALGLSGGKHWAHRRKFLTPAFTFGLQNEFLQVFNEQAKIMTKVVDEECVDKGIVNLYPYCFRLSLDIICEAAMGTKPQTQIHKEGKYLETIVKLSKVIVKRILSPWLQPNLIWKFSPTGREEKKYLSILHKFTEDVIKERKLKLENDNELSQKLEKTKKTRLAFLDLLLQASNKGTILTDTEIRNETDLFMVAGHDTSGTGLAWTLFLLAHHPEIQKKVQAELDSIFSDDPERPVTTEDLTKMNYLEMCFKESLRLRPPIPFIFRALEQDFELSDGKILPAGTSLAISIYHLHMDPTVYPNPEKFDPDRFSVENSNARNSYAFVPFAAGPRNCIGQRFAKSEAKVTLSTLLRRYWFEPGESWEGVKFCPDVNLRPINGLSFKVSKRNL